MVMQLHQRESLFDMGAKKTNREVYLKALFDSARKKYPGKKRLVDTEWANFKKKCKDWRALLEVKNGVCALEWVIGIQIEAKADELREKGFTPNWCAFAVWINQRKFEEYLE